MQQQRKPFGRSMQSIVAAIAAGRERRAQARMRMLEAGKLSFGMDSASTDCTITDLSETGANVLVKSETFVPKNVVLYRLRRRMSRHATIVWRKGARIGLQFTPRARSLFGRLFGWTR
jgi:hypothetical protein